MQEAQNSWWVVEAVLADRVLSEEEGSEIVFYSPKLASGVRVNNVIRTYIFQRRQVAV